jgi:hypothetical protein
VLFLYYNDKFYYISGYFCKSSDTVGAGDSFTSFDYLEVTATKGIKLCPVVEHYSRSRRC